MTTNLPASVRARLLNFARSENLPFQEVLVRYGMERTLYRLQKSEAADQFLLKGAMLFLDWTQELHRPTRDIDFLSNGSPDVSTMERRFRAIIATDVEPDGLVYLPDSVRADEIREADIYRGVRVKFAALLDSARIPIQVDIGFGDAVVPEPVSVHIPPLLEFPGPRLLGYTRYTAVAEKYHAMLELGEVNSRMKDYYDIWMLCGIFDFEGAQLQASIDATCDRRGTPIPSERPPALTQAFAQLPGKQIQWSNFAKKVRDRDDVPPLHEIIERLEVFLWPPTEAIQNGESFTAIWDAGAGWE